jgi:hypothetical protein
LLHMGKIPCLLFLLIPFISKLPFSTIPFLSCMLHYITLYYIDRKLVKMTAGCGISHTITKTHIQYNWSIPKVHTHTYINQNTVNLHYVHKPLKGWVSFRQ